MRKFLLAVLFLSLVPATNAPALVPATEARAGSGVLIDHLATVDTSEVWENGSEGLAFVRIGWPAEDYAVHIVWEGVVYDDAGNVLINGRHYDIEWENHPLELQPAVEEFHLRGLQRVSGSYSRTPPAWITSTIVSTPLSSTSVGGATVQ